MTLDGWDTHGIMILCACIWVGGRMLGLHKVGYVDTKKKGNESHADESAQHPCR